MIPLVIGLVQVAPYVVLAVEKMFGHHTGPTKKSAAMAALGDMLNIASTTAGTPGADSSAMAFVDDLIEATVKYFNSNGTITHGGTQ